MLFPGDAGFEDEIASWNTIFAHHPKVVVVADCVDDVKYAVNYAAQQNLPIAVQATGHGVSIPADNAMFINTRLLDDVSINATSRIATIGAGAKWATVIQQAGPLGLGPLVGSTPDLSAVGYTGGGGLPVLGRKFGFGVDRVTELEIVTADGIKRMATPSVNSNLFFAARGGRGNFGVITQMKVRLLDQSRLYGGKLFYDGQNVPALLKAYIDWTKTQPEEMASSIAIVTSIPGPPDGQPKDLQVHLRIAYTGSATTGEHLVQPLLAFNPIVNQLREMPYTDIGTIHDDPVFPQPSFIRSGLLRTIDSTTADKIMEVIGTGSGHPPGVVEIRHMGGALARSNGAAPNAIGFRSAAKYHFLAGHVVPPDAADGAKVVQQNLFTNIAPWNTGAPFVNFLGYNDTTPDKVKAAYESTTYSKLRSIKKAVDPKNRIRINFNIPPA